MGEKIPVVAFDLEIATIVGDNQDWNPLRPLGISCAATFTSDGEERLWHGVPDGEDGEYPNRLTVAECRELATYLVEQMIHHGYRSVTWNGAGFDFRTLYEECCRDDNDDEYWLNQCVLLALGHYDPGFQMLCEKGYMIGLSKAAEGLGVAGKMEGMSGALAPQMWADGRASQDRVLEYVMQDVQATMNVWEALHEQRVLPWISRSGRLNEWHPRFVEDVQGRPHMLTVGAAWLLEYPDTSWMSGSRLTRGKALEWTGQVQVPAVPARMAEKGIRWWDMQKLTAIPPFTRGRLADGQPDNIKYRTVAFDEPIGEILTVAREVIDL